VGVKCGGGEKVRWWGWWGGGRKKKHRRKGIYEGTGQPEKTGRCTPKVERGKSAATGEEVGTRRGDIIRSTGYTGCIGEKMVRN